MRILWGEVTYRFGDKVTLHQLGKPVTGELHAVNAFALYLVVGNDRNKRIKDYPFNSLDEEVRPVPTDSQSRFIGITIRDTHVRSKT